MAVDCWRRGLRLPLLLCLLLCPGPCRSEPPAEAAVLADQCPSGEPACTDGGGQRADADAAKAALFNQWMAEHYESPLYLEVQAVPGMRFGAFAKEDIAVGQVYSSTPAKLLINRDAIKRSDKTGYLKAGLDGALLLFLLAEKAKGEASFWHPYINLLPTVEDYQALPSYWPEDELTAALNNTVCHQKVMAGKADEQNEYTRLREFLEQADPTAVPTFTFEAFKWARTVRDSRTIWLQGRDRQFVPMLDMVNCKHHRDKNKVHRTTYGPKGSADTPALWNFKAGKQVFENYGQTNLFYYQFHGFSIANNAYDCYNFDLSHHAAAVTAWGSRNGRHFEKFEFCLSPGQEIPIDLLAIFAAQTAIKKDRGVMKDRDAIKGFEKYLKDTVAAIPGDATFDGELVKSPDTPPRQKEAIRYRKRERRLLQKVHEEWNAQRFRPRPIPRRNPDEL
eukprot:EG_transcript_8903